MAKGKVTFDDDACKGCELCVAVCPVKIIELNREKITAKDTALHMWLKWKNVLLAAIVQLCALIQ